MRFSECLKMFEEHVRLQIKQPTIDRYVTDLRLLCLYLRDPVIETVSENHILEYMNLMLRLGWKQNSLYPKTCGYRRFFEFLRLKHFNVLDPKLIPVIRREFHMPRVCTEEEIAKIFDVIDEGSKERGLRRYVHLRNKAIISLYIDTGARNGEILQLNLEDVQNEPVVEGGERFYCATLKTEKSRGQRPFRQVYWTQTTQDALDAWLIERDRLARGIVFEDAEALFVGSSKGHGGKRLTNGAVATMLRQYSKQAGIRTVNPHSFRHRKGRDTILAGGSSADVMNILGHSQINSSTPYTMMIGDQLKTRAIAFLKGKLTDKKLSTRIFKTPSP